MMQAETLQQQMEVFLDMTHEHAMSGEMDSDNMVSDADIAHMLDEEVVREEGGAELDKDIDESPKDIENELGGK